MSGLTQVSSLWRLIGVLLGGAILASACGNDGPSPGEERAAARARKVAPAKAAPVNVDMVAAPTSARTPGMVSLKFAVSQKPEVGRPVDIELALISNTSIERMLATFQVSEGLELRSGAKTPVFKKPEAGAAISHTVTIVPSRDGIFSISAIVLAESATDSITRTFSIPVIAGEGLSAEMRSANRATQSMAILPAAESRQSQ